MIFVEILVVKAAMVYNFECQARSKKYETKTEVTRNDQKSYFSNLLHDPKQFE